VREQRPWSVEASLIELSKQVGDLAPLVMMAESYYLPKDPRYAATTEKIGDELARTFGLRTNRPCPAAGHEPASAGRVRLLPLNQERSS
jgi:hypothetical protein